MFDMGWSELLLVAVLAIVFVGPKDLPRVMRTAGQYMARMRAMVREFQNSFEDLARESELEELRKQVAEMRETAMKPLTDLQRSASISPDQLSATATPASPEATTTEQPAAEPGKTEEKPAVYDKRPEDKGPTT